jgi:hypothetical protein
MKNQEVKRENEGEKHQLKTENIQRWMKTKKKKGKNTYIHKSAFFLKIGEMSPKSENKIQNSKMK